MDGVENCVCKNLHTELFSNMAEDLEKQQNDKIHKTI